MKYKLVHCAAIAEADFGFGRVDVDVDRCRVNVDKQAISRVAAAVQRVLIGFAQGVAKQLVAHEAAIDIAVLGVAARARMGGQRTMAEDAQAVPALPGIDAARFGQEVLAEDRSSTAACVAFR